jgi:hypothetical protein
MNAGVPRPDDRAMAKGQKIAIVKADVVEYFGR